MLKVFIIVGIVLIGIIGILVLGVLDKNNTINILKEEWLKEEYKGE